ncbi:hypothetical protein TFLX_00683 [Thermoflexales bacterium]|nr:hypothetical protein TFLX_00683 [Thermoflexales bacterium]
MNLKSVYLLLRVALIIGLLWATQLTPVFAGGVVGDGVGGAACDAGAVEYGAVTSMVYLPLVIK